MIISNNFAAGYYKTGSKNHWYLSFLFKIEDSWLRTIVELDFGSDSNRGHLTTQLAGVQPNERYFVIWFRWFKVQFRVPKRLWGFFRRLEIRRYKRR